MAKHTNLLKTDIVTDESFNGGGILNQALIEILIAKKVISEEELVSHIGKINRQLEFFFDGQTGLYE